MSAYTPTPAEEAIRQAEGRVASCTPTPFYLVRFTRQLLALLRNFYSTQNKFPSQEAGEFIPIIPECLGWSEDEAQRTLDVEPLYTENPPETEKPSVFLGLGPAKFTDTSITGNDLQVSQTQHQVTRAKKCEGTATVVCQHLTPDIALFLLELLQTSIEGSRKEWIKALGLFTFSVVELTPPAPATGGAQRVMRARLVISYSAILSITETEASLPLRQIEVRSTSV